jgi:hypothetical protein
MSEESDDSDSSDSSRHQKILVVAGMMLCVIQFAFFIFMVMKLVEMNFGQGITFASLAYTSAFIYRNLENSGAIPVTAENDDNVVL